MKFKNGSNVTKELVLFRILEVLQVIIVHFKVGG